MSATGPSDSTPPILSLRSPRETLGGYVILSRLIDKVRLHARRKLPQEYVQQLLMPSPALDGRLLEFTGLDGNSLRNAILREPTDAAVLAWVERNARPRTNAQKRRWAEGIDAYRPDADRVKRRKETYPAVAATFDIGTLSVFDLIDLDEGRIRKPG